MPQLSTLTERIVQFWYNTRIKPDGAEILERVAYYLTKQYTTTASFQAHGRLLPWQQEALDIVINLERAVRFENA